MLSNKYKLCIIVSTSFLLKMSQTPIVYAAVLKRNIGTAVTEPFVFLAVLAAQSLCGNLFQ